MDSLDITPSQPVYFKAYGMSLKVEIPPFEITGIKSVSLIRFMMYRFVEPTLVLLCSLHLPCTVKSEAPAASIRLANFNVYSSVGRHLILTVTGILRFLANISTIAIIVSGYSSK